MSQIAELNTVRHGRVRTVFHSKGYGFVRATAEGQDYFFHMSSFKNEEDFFDVKPTSKLAFTLFETDDKRIQAGDIVLERTKNRE